MANFKDWRPEGLTVAWGRGASDDAWLPWPDPVKPAELDQEAFLVFHQERPPQGWEIIPGVIVCRKIKDHG